MAIKKSGEKWLVDIYPDGRAGKRVRKRFDTKAEASRFEKLVLRRAHEGKPWNDSSGDKRRLSELIERWYQVKGMYLKDGPKRRRYLLQTAELLGDPQGVKLKPGDFHEYAAIRKQQGIADKTLNNHLGYLNAVYNYLRDIGEIEYENPLLKVKMIKIDERELSWLSGEEIQHLLATIEKFTSNPHVLLLTKICLATGARWGEAESLTKKQVADGKLHFVRTKSGKSRSVPISFELFDEICFHLDKYVAFTPSLSAFRRALKASEIELPRGQAAHVLRHSFASHFVMNGGNILTLQRILGHSTIVMTMRYAHLAPDHLKETISLNPLGIVSDGS
ncbi:tyrosine-type recombinase/integrase [Spongiibacter sp.]|uniref:phage integrase n=1 Tax=Spongiibacter sp. TaxID=2024860 RepID=UPI000C5D3678|nr:tyrosine-type recombinase/integrase [Spongiibacter sp.]MBU71298.1 integrase [Spongiibacter sp.]